jgi:hypothetical protein
MKQKFVLLTFMGLLGYAVLMADSGGYSQDYTGATGASPGGCSCHGVSVNLSPTLTLDSAGTAVTSYKPGQSYNIILSSPQVLGFPNFGFELNCVKTATAGTSTAVQAGTWGTMPAGARTRGTTNKFVEQSSTRAASSKFYTMTIPWTAPVAGTGSVSMYGLINAVDGTGGQGGDEGSKTAPVLTIAERLSAAAATATITVKSTTICSTDTPKFTCTVAGGTATAYDWQINGSSVGTSAPTYQSLVYNNDMVSCIVTVAGVPVTSNVLTMKVNPAPAKPSINRIGAQLNSSTPLGLQWYKDGSPIAGANLQQYTPTVSGNYVVKTNVAGCSNSSDPFVYTIGSISQVARDAGINLYPSPNVGNFTIESPATAGTELVITDMTGRTVHHELLTETKQVIKGLTLSPEMYIATIRLNGVSYPVSFQVK